MKLDAPFICTPALSALLDEAMRSTAAYQELEKNGLFNPIPALFPKADKGLARRIREQSTTIIRERLYEHRDELPQVLQDEIEDLNQHMLGMVTGHGAPALHIKNLPQGMAGVMAAMGLLAYSANIQTVDKHESAEFIQVKRTGPMVMSHKFQKLHRDSLDPLLSGLVGLNIGRKALTTVVHTSDEVVEEVARHYHRLDHDTPLDAAQMDEVRQLMREPCFTLGIHHMRHQPLLIPDPRAGEGHVRLHPKLWNHSYPAPNILTLWPHLEEGRASDVPKQRRIAEAVQTAMSSLKQKDGVVIGPGEVVYYNNAFVFHGSGKCVEDPRTQFGESRELVNISVWATQPQHKRPYPAELSKENLRMTMVRDQGYTYLADSIPARDRG